jgi:hypothetical protein
MHRTSLMLDEETRRAARDLAVRYDCSVSEAIRRAVLKQRESVVGLSTAARLKRRKTLRRLFELFDDNDAEAEVARLKREDAGF